MPIKGYRCYWHLDIVLHPLHWKSVQNCINLQIYWCDNSKHCVFFRKNFKCPFTTNLPLQNLSSPVVSVDELFKSECPVAVLVNSLHAHVRGSCHSSRKLKKLKTAHIRGSCHSCHSHSPPKREKLKLQYFSQCPVAAAVAGLRMQCRNCQRLRNRPKEFSRRFKKVQTENIYQAGGTVDCWSFNKVCWLLTVDLLTKFKPQTTPPLSAWCLQLPEGSRSRRNGSHLQ